MTKILEFPTAAKRRELASASSASPRELWKTLERIRVALDLPNKTLCDYLGILESEAHASRTNGRPPSIASLQLLCKRTNLTVESIITGRIDFKTLSRRLAGDNLYLPERYAVGALSRRSTAENVLNYIQLNYGWDKRAELLNRLQLTEAHFANPHALISIRFTLDAATHLHESHRSTRQLREIGQLSTITHWNSALGVELRALTSIESVYASYIENLATKYLERNFNWRITSINPQSCILSGRPSEELVDAIGHHEASNPLGCEIRIGVLEAIPLYLNLPLAKVTKLACVGQGDDSCRFQIEYATHKNRSRVQFATGTSAIH